MLNQDKLISFITFMLIFLWGCKKDGNQTSRLTHEFKEVSENIVGVQTFTLFTDPTLTTVGQHSMRMGNAAAELFLEEISSDSKKFIPQKIVLKPELVVRQSSLKKKT